MYTSVRASTMTFLDPKDSVFPFSLSIVPAATVILGEQSNHQDVRAAANGRAGQRGPRLMGTNVCPLLLCCFYGDLKYN